MTRLLAHSLLIGMLVTAPAIRVVCHTSCAPGEGSLAELAGQEPAPECHDPDGSDHHPRHPDDSAPLDDDCTHGGESSSSSLLASLKAAKGDGVNTPLVAMAAVGSHPATACAAQTSSLSAPLSDCRLQLFLTPLRI